MKFTRNEAFPVNMIESQSYNVKIEDSIVNTIAGGYDLAMVKDPISIKEKDSKFYCEGKDANKLYSIVTKLNWTHVPVIITTHG